ncbi:hypothetical protein AMES_3076 [Amycolatopsis mediterranei S699]|uniref:Alginate regulatory protein AlgP n=2 Tax=Amycolatopsis mediterranei TaxID=33910 RepID=A0A0H3D3V4_AMYMU|nr:hypothetical protein [Amycolatopsis mediterranei]ADJ44901.1 hypothetical protein AMED_3110 [Amycolatopsis mediterranei U32]AEK41651.1 hypothetical protein RAM_15815 [Amycolatopsis mediterranei S699]AFO76612.1 hypothetical protein AMES_3076 [Amycolatopsis mediterranei S699]AGT83741.1 hypothetical protein B737_3077 [Amycolatopsis mediterranei RB]KDO07273.1 hypothetical protein DV26_28725 [Amycolatopsis mediterranei]
MSQGDAPVGRSVKTAAAGVRDLAAEAARVGAAAAARAVEITDRKLAEGKDELAKVGRAATKDLDKSTRSSRRDVLTNSGVARDEVLARAAKLRDPGRKAAQAVATVVSSAGESGRKRRKAVATAKRDLAVALQEAKSVARGERTKRARWPWLVAMGAVAAAIVAVVQIRRPNPLAENTPAQQGEKPAGTPATAPTPPAATTQPAAAATADKPEAAAKPTQPPTPASQPAAKPAATPTPASAEKPAQQAAKAADGANGRAPAGRGQNKAH